MAERHQHPSNLLKIGVRAAEKAMRGKRPGKTTFERGERAAAKAIMVADPQAGTSTHKHRAARYSHGVYGIARRSRLLAQKLLWTGTGKGPAWEKRLESRRDASRDPAPKHLLSEADLRRQSAESLERLYNDGRATKADVVRWVRESSKKSGRIYEPVYRAGGRFGERLWLSRRPDAENKLFAKRGGYFKRDPSVGGRDLGRKVRGWFGSEKLSEDETRQADALGYSIGASRSRHPESVREQSEKLKKLFERIEQKRGKNARLQAQKIAERSAREANQSLGRRDISRDPRPRRRGLRTTAAKKKRRTRRVS